MIRSLLDVRLSRVAIALLAVVSIVATVLILTSGGTRSPAQLAALATLRQRPAASAPAVIVASAPTVTTTAAAAPAPPPAAPSSTAEDSSAAPPVTVAPASDSTPESGDPNTSDVGTEVGTGEVGGGDDISQTPSTPTTTETTGTTPATTTPTSDSTPKVGHVFEIDLTTTGYRAAFGKGSAAPYLRSLTAKGTLLSGYASLGRGELADQLAMVSGQGPNADTAAGCGKYREFRTGVLAKANGLVPGNGCVYPETALTIGDQVTSKGHTWRAYVADMGKQTCVHPNSDADDDVALPGTAAGYDTRHNPFIYFHSLLDLGDCATDDLDLDKLPADLSHKSRTAMFSLIAPGACEDAAPAMISPTPADNPASSISTTSTTSTPSSPPPTAATTTTGTTPASTTGTTPSATTGPTPTSTTGTTTGPTPTLTSAPSGCPAGQPAGIAAEDTFLKRWVPRILRSAGFKDDGVLIIAFSGAPTGGQAPVKRTGALVISRYVTRGRTVATTYGPYSLLHSVEDMLGDTPLAHAASAPSFTATLLHETG